MKVRAPTAVDNAGKLLFTCEIFCLLGRILADQQQPEFCLVPASAQGLRKQPHCFSKFSFYAGLRLYWESYCSGGAALLTHRHSGSRCRMLCSLDWLCWLAAISRLAAHKVCLVRLKTGISSQPSGLKQTATRLTGCVPV